MGLWPAPRRSKHRTSGQSTSTRPIAYTACAFRVGGGSCAVPVAAHMSSGTIHNLLGMRWSILGHMNGENTGVMALTAQTPIGMECRSPIADNVACRLRSACPKRTILRASLLESRQAQPLLTPSAQHWYPFGSIKKLNTMPESYKRPNVKRGGFHSQCASSLTPCRSRQMDAGRPLI